VLLVAIVLCMVAFIRMDVGFRILRGKGAAAKDEAHPQQMV
jgi:hypothetical protein